MTRLVFIAATVLCACGRADGAKYGLEGSLSTLMNLGYDEVRFESSEQDFSVHFVRHKSAMVEDTPLKVTWALLNELPFAAGIVDFDLTETIPNNGGQRAVISRDVLMDPRTMFPHIRLGQLHFARVPTADSNLAGSLNATFENGTDSSSGTTVFGDFVARVPP